MTSIRWSVIAAILAFTGAGLAIAYGDLEVARWLEAGAIMLAVLSLHDRR